MQINFCFISFTWYIPLKCYFGRSPNDTDPLFVKFDVQAKERNLYLTYSFHFTSLSHSFF